VTTASEHPQTGRRSGRHRLLKDNVTVIADAVLPVYLNPAGKPDESDAVVRADQFMPDANQQLARAEYRLAVELSRSGEKDFAEKYFARAGELSRYDFTIRRGSMPLRAQGSVRRTVLSSCTRSGRPSAGRTTPSRSTALRVDRNRGPATATVSVGGRMPTPPKSNSYSQTAVGVTVY
jgi:hypothetical protein